MPNLENKFIIADNQFLVIEALQKLLLDEFNAGNSTIVSSRHALVQAIVNYPDSLLIIDYNHIDFEDVADFQKFMLTVGDVCTLVLVNAVLKNELIALNAIGIKNILLKTADRDELCTGIRSALSRKKYYCQEVLDLYSEIHLERHGFKENISLTASEIDIVRAIAEGFTTKQIAARKFISPHTVMTHRKNIFRKLNINNSSELVMFAIRTGIIGAIDYQI